MQIIELSSRPELLKNAVDYFWKCWGSPSNYIFYEDCIRHSLHADYSLPKFYVGLLENEIVCSYALLRNDLISRQDLRPWFACLFVNEEHRGQGWAGLLLEHGLKEAKRKGFDQLYLSTDLENFYERKGWEFLAQGYGVTGGEIKMYFRST